MMDLQAGVLQGSGWAKWGCPLMLAAHCCYTGAGVLILLVGGVQQQGKADCIMQQCC